MGKEKRLMSEQEMDQALRAIAQTIIKEDLQDMAIVGIRSRGVPLAHWLARHVADITRTTPKVGILDINLYRDDLSEVGESPIIRQTELPFSVQGATIILVDDVLYTGRTIRAALDAIIDYGRPKRICLAVLVDRGWRELPIQADYVGKQIETTADEVVKVMVQEMDGKNEVIIKQEFSNR